MEGIYIEPRSCFKCCDSGFMEPTVEICKACREIRKHKAKILKIGIGKNCDKMIVLLDNGTIKTINDYEIKDVRE